MKWFGRKSIQIGPEPVPEGMDALDFWLRRNAPLGNLVPSIRLIAERLGDLELRLGHLEGNAELWERAGIVADKLKSKKRRKA